MCGGVLSVAAVCRWERRVEQNGTDVHGDVFEGFGKYGVFLLCAEGSKEMQCHAG